MAVAVVYPRRKREATTENRRNAGCYLFDEIDTVQEMVGGSWDKVRSHCSAAKVLG